MKKEIRQFETVNNNNMGFTLVELLVAMLITTIVSVGILSAYTNQQEAQLAQKQVVEMQQSSRAGIYYMTTEIRMAGYDPARTAGAGIVNAGNGSDSANALIFTYYNAAAAGDTTDNDNDAATADADEVLQAVEYFLFDSNPSGAVTLDLGRRNGARLNAVAENIQTLQFSYLDITGTVMAMPIVASNLANIRAIQITIVATVDQNNKDYVGGNGRTLTTTVKCRNLGL